MEYSLLNASDAEIEKHIREVNKDLPDGLYNIGDDEMPCFTGKEGKIQFEIELTKSLIKSINGK